jgi:hypothetical protein
LTETAGVRLLLAALVTLFSILVFGIGIQQRQRVLERLAGPAGSHINDFDRWMSIAPAFVRHHADYENDDLPTPPISLLVFGPLASLGRANAQLAWALLKLPVACAAFVFVVELVRRAGVAWTPWTLGLVAGGWWLAVVIDFQEGQMNLVTLLPLAAGLYIAQIETARRTIVAGALIGLAAAIKVTPIVFVAYFLWRRRFTLAAAAAAGLVIWSAAPAVAFGWTQNARWLGEWARIMLVPYVTKGTVAYATSQSIGSFALRTLTSMPAFDVQRNGIIHSHYMNIASIGEPSVRQLVRVVMIGVGILGLWWMRRPLGSLESRRYVAEIGAVTAFMLWFSERTWIPHYVSFIMALAAAGMVAADPTASERSSRLAVWALLLFAIATPFASEAGRLFGPDGVDWAKAAGIYLWPSIAVTAAVVLAAPQPE